MGLSPRVLSLAQMPDVAAMRGLYSVDMQLGMSEMIFIFLLALIIFGPRKLPEIGREVGKALAEFKRASNDFKQQLQSEVDLLTIEEERKKYRENAEQLLKEAQGGFSVQPPTQGGVARTLSDAGVSAEDLQAPLGTRVEPLPSETSSESSPVSPEQQPQPAIPTASKETNV